MKKIKVGYEYVDITPKVLDFFKKANISTSWDIDEFDRGGGWLANLKSYTFKRKFKIEGPCAFYGGPYGPNIWTADGGLCEMGAASYSHSPLPEGMIVGRYCSIGKGLRFLDFAHPADWVSTSVAFFKPLGAKQLTAIHHLSDRLINASGGDFFREVFDAKCGKAYPQLGNDVWIGENVSLGMGVKIGDGAIIAANSTVTRNVPPYAIVAGAPAEVKKYRFDGDIVAGLVELKWWNYSFADFAGLDFTDPSLFLRQLTGRISAGSISEWEPPNVIVPAFNASLL